jgi:hypothetical protein
MLLVNAPKGINRLSFGLRLLSNALGAESKHQGIFS